MLTRSGDFVSGMESGSQGSGSESGSRGSGMESGSQPAGKEHAIGPMLRQSFDNRTADALLYSLRKQWNVDVYRYLYDIYKNEVFPEFGLTQHSADYFYNKDNYNDIEQMMILDADQFLLYLFHRYERSYLMAAGMTPSELMRKVERKVERKLKRG